MTSASVPHRGSLPHDRLYVLVPPRAEWPSARTASSSVVIRWLAPGTAGRPASTGEATLATLPAHRAAWLLIDDRDVFATSVPVPRLNDARLRLALPALLEERTLADPADCHLVWRRRPGKGGDTETVDVAAIDRAFLRRVVETFEAASLRLAGASTVAAILAPARDGVIQALACGARGLVRLEGDEAFGFALDDAAAALALIRARMPAAHLQWLVPAPGAAELTALPAAAQAIPWAGAMDGLNFLQGDFDTSNHWGPIGRLVTASRQSGSWRVPAMWIGICLLIGIGGLNAYWWKLSRQQSQLRQEIRQTFRDAFPGEPAIDELAQARQAVARLRARAGQPAPQDFSVLQARTAQLLASAPVGAVAALDYDGQRLSVHLASQGAAGSPLENMLAARAPALGLRLTFGPDHTITLEASDDASDAVQAGTGDSRQTAQP